MECKQAPALIGIHHGDLVMKNFKMAILPSLARLRGAAVMQFKNKLYICFKKPYINGLSTKDSC